MWTDHLKVNPLGILLGSYDAALVYAVERDLLGRAPGNIEDIWDMDHPQRLFAKQRADGAWVYKGNRPGDEFGENYELLQTWRNLRVLIEIYAFTREHPAVERAAEFIFSCQTTEGDIRGILSNQYTPYYMGAMMETLIKAGYAQDERIMKGFEWLLSMRQDDGVGSFPYSSTKCRLITAYMTSHRYCLSGRDPFHTWPAAWSCARLRLIRSTVCVLKRSLLEIY